MADNISITQGTGTVVAADQLPDGSYVQYVKLVDGTADGTTKAVVNANGLKVDGSAVTQPISASALPLPAGAATLAGQQAGQATFGSVTANRTVIYDATGAAVDFTAASPVTQSGTWTVQIGNTPNTTAIKVDGSAVTQPVSIAAALSLASTAFDVATTITRPANTTAYTAGDVLGGALDLGVLGPSGAAVMITSVQLEADIAAIPSGQTTWSLHLYNVTPPSATADNGAWDLPSGDRASYLGQITLTTLIDQGSTLYMESNGINKQVKLSGTHLFGYLVTVGGFTPAANSEVYKVTVHTVSL